MPSERTRSGPMDRLVETMGSSDWSGSKKAKNPEDRNIAKPDQWANARAIKKASKALCHLRPLSRKSKATKIVARPENSQRIIMTIHVPNHSGT